MSSGAVFSSNVQPKQQMTEPWAEWACACREPNGAPTEHGGYVVRCSVCGVARQRPALVAVRSA